MAGNQKPIGPVKKGALHQDLGIPQGQKIGKDRLESAKNSSDPTVRKRANFALNMAYGNGGPVTGVPHHSKKAMW